MGGKNPYFFEEDEVTPYEEPMFTDLGDKMIKNFYDHENEFRSFSRYLTMTSSTDSEVNYAVDFDKYVRHISSIKVDKPGHYSLRSFSSNDDRERRLQKDSMLMDIGWNNYHVDKVRSYLKDINCDQIEVEGNDIKIGYQYKNWGQYQYTFKHNPTSTLVETLSDSCLFIHVKDNIFLQYEGTGRGPDCIKSDNPEGHMTRWEKVKYLWTNKEQLNDSTYRLPIPDTGPLEESK